MTFCFVNAFANSITFQYIITFSHYIIAMDENDNKQLLTEILKEHYKSRYSLVEEALEEINAYSKNPSKNAYKQTLNKLYALMSDLPPKILLYFLTMVPFPNIEESNSEDVFSMMKKTHDCLPKNIRPVLLSYLKEMSSACKHTDTETQIIENECVETNHMTNSVEDVTTYNISYKLVDICARYIFANMEKIHRMYEDKNTAVWELIYNCENDQNVLQQCYTVVKYLNKQRKLLRMIEDHEITLDIFEEEYGNSKVFLKQNRVLTVLEKNLMETSSDILIDAIAKFVRRC